MALSGILDKTLWTPSLCGLKIMFVQKEKRIATGPITFTVNCGSFLVSLIRIDDGFVSRYVIAMRPTFLANVIKES